MKLKFGAPKYTLAVLNDPTATCFIHKVIKVSDGNQGGRVVKVLDLRSNGQMSLWV